MKFYAIQLTHKGNTFTLASSSNYQNAEWLYQALKGLRKVELLKVDKVRLCEINENS